MSFLLKKDDLHGVKADLSSFINKKESISERDSPRRMDIVLKRLEEDEDPSMVSMDTANDGGGLPEGPQNSNGSNLPKVRNSQLLFCML